MKVSNEAREAAGQVLMARLTRTSVERRDGLLQRIAAVRAGLLDAAPEVQSAQLAIRATLERAAVRAFEVAVVSDKPCEIAAAIRALGETE